MEVEEKRKEISSIIPQDWIDEGHKQFILRVYSSLGVPYDYAHEAYKYFAKTEYKIFSTRVLSGIVKVHEGSDFDELMPIWSSGKDGIDCLHMQSITLKYPEGNYLYLISPLTENTEKNLQTRNAMNFLRSLIVCMCGQKIAYELVHEGILSLEDSKIKAFKNAIPIPVGHRGPFTHFVNKEYILLLLNNISNIDIKVRNRIIASTEILNEAILLQSAFHYFLAYEILCDCMHTNKKHALRDKIISFTGVKDIYQEIGWSRIVRMRKDYAHAGIKIDLEPNTISFMQLLYLDLLIQELGLEPQKHILQMINNGHDLSQLGINKKDYSNDGMVGSKEEDIDIEETQNSIAKYWEEILKKFH